MASIYELNQKKNQYMNLKNSVTDIINSLNSNISILETPSSNIGIYYEVNGQSADKNAIYNEKKKLIDKRDYLNNCVIPAINDNINSIQNDIKQEEARIEEQQRREEEARRQEQQRAEEQRRLEEQRKQQQQQTKQKSSSTSPKNVRVRPNILRTK